MSGNKSIVYEGQNNGSAVLLQRASNPANNNNSRIKPCRYGSRKFDTHLSICVPVSLRCNGLKICFSEPWQERVKRLFEEKIIF